MKLTVTQGTEVELRDEAGRLIARCYTIYSKLPDPNRPGFKAVEKTGTEIAEEIAARFNGAPSL